MVGHGARGCRALKVGDPNDVHHGCKDTKTEGDNQDDLLFQREAHAGQDGHGQEEDGKIGDEVNGGGGQIQGDDIDAGGIVDGGVVEDGAPRMALEHIDQGQGKAGGIHDDERDVVCPAEDFFSFGQGQVEDEDGCL